MNQLLQRAKMFLAHFFDLNEDKATDAVIIDSIRKNVEFKGVNLWALIFAILIASIGLNVNSTAVIIGAMLISPIMGPVMGIGLGIGINDLNLVRKGARNLLLATLISITTSTLYFLITPLHEAQSELLARTSPSTWDVFIAFFGGAAGMVAATRTEKSNVIPGVAIATALMPPLCTAGFGLAAGNWYYFFGALYLYFINSVFIAIATYLVARYLKMQRLQLENAQSQIKANRYIIIIVVITIAPSIYMAYKIVNKSIFYANSGKFVKEQFNFENTQVVSKTYVYNSKPRSINVLVIGKELNQKKLDSLNHKMDDYNLHGTKLIIRQGLNAKQEIDISQIKAGILEDVLKQAPRPVKAHALDSAVFAELKILYPAVSSFGLNNMVIHHATNVPADTVKVALLHFINPIKKGDKIKLQNWLRKRCNSPALQLVWQ